MVLVVFVLAVNARLAWAIAVYPGALVKCM
jgi:hypothetical protein